MGLVYTGVAGGTGAFLAIELALFGVAFFLTAVLGGARKILAVGVGLGLAFATLLAAVASGYFSPGEVFTIGVIVGGALYPGWALGVGVGVLARGMGARRSNR